MASIKVSTHALARPAVARPHVQVQPSRTVKPQIRHVAASAVAAPAPEATETTDWESVAAGLEGKSPLEIMDHALATFGTEIAIAFSGAEDVALIEYAHLTGRKYRVFSLDTGRLNPETYQLFAAVEKHYGIRIEYTFPESQEVVDLVREKGMFSFYEDGHQECCRYEPRQHPLGSPPQHTASSCSWEHPRITNYYLYSTCFHQLVLSTLQGPQGPPSPQAAEDPEGLDHWPA